MHFYFADFNIWQWLTYQKKIKKLKRKNSSFNKKTLKKLRKEIRKLNTLDINMKIALYNLKIVELNISKI